MLGKIKREVNIVKVKEVFKGQKLSGFKSMRQYSLQESRAKLRWFSIWTENNSNHRVTEMRWERMIRSSPLSLGAGQPGYTECFVLRPAKPRLVQALLRLSISVFLVLLFFDKCILSE